MKMKSAPGLDFPVNRSLQAAFNRRLILFLITAPPIFFVMVKPTRVGKRSSRRRLTSLNDAVDALGLRLAASKSFRDLIVSSGRVDTIHPLFGPNFVLSKVGSKIQGGVGSSYSADYVKRTASSCRGSAVWPGPFGRPLLLCAHESRGDAFALVGLVDTCVS